MIRIRWFLKVALALALAATQTRAAVPHLLNFQGLLRDAGGAPVGDGTHTVTLSIYAASTGGSPLWTETKSVNTADGLFTTLLGSVNPVPDSVFKDTTRYLAVKVGADPELVPRILLVSVAYAYRVSTVDGATGGTVSGDVTIASDLSVSGKATIGSGHTNTSGFAFVAGQDNTADGNHTTVGGGRQNAASNSQATVGGGNLNTASGVRSTVGGGGVNLASGQGATVGGGINDTASAISATVSGGSGNVASGSSATVGGGSNNRASGTGAAIGGGTANSATAQTATVAGGIFNAALAVNATVGGGGADTASGAYSTVPGGTNNTASGMFSFAAGRRAKARHTGAFVWADQGGALGADFASTADNQFLIRAAGGVGIGTASPTEQLQVAGRVHSTSGGFRFPDGTTQTTAAVVPPGVIVMWSGLLANIPAGWALCNGLNGTPDLRDRFVLGAASGEDPGATGGSSSHSHSVNPPNTTSAENTATVSLFSGPVFSGFAAAQAHTHDVDIPTFTSGSTATLPPYYKVAFIMKL